MVALTAAACVAALVFRTSLRSRYWAWQVVRCGDTAERAVYLTALCNAGDAGRWGTSALMDDPSAEIRQFGTVVLQHVRSDWARGRLLAALADPDEGVRELAALGLALRGDPSIIPALQQMYRTGSEAAALAACTALERMGTRKAIAAIEVLARAPADATRRAAVVDALAGIGEPRCVPPLLELLADDRVCAVPPRSARRGQAALADLVTTGHAAPRVPLPPMHGETRPAEQTIAERAAAALARISGVGQPYSSAWPADERRRAAQAWADWYAAQPGRP